MRSEEQPPSKKMHYGDLSEDKSSVKIGTHDGTFHCDEVLACYLLKQLPKYKDAGIIRSRDPPVLEKCDIVVDVGAVYNPAENKFDHHQREFNESMNSLNPEMKWTTKLSSAGLIYFHFGEEVIKQLILPQTLDAENLKTIYHKMYEKFIEEIDAVDNGIDQYEGEPKYSVTTTIGARVSRMNPQWNDKNFDSHRALFDRAIDVVGNEFKERVLGLISGWLPVRTIVEEAVKNRYHEHSSGEIAVLKQYCPWKDHLRTLEEEQDIQPPIKYVIFTDTLGSARVQCVSAGRNTFENRLSLPSEWHGLRGNELCEVSGIPRCIFVHATGFIGGNSCKDGAVAMAAKSLEMHANSG